MVGIEAHLQWRLLQRHSERDWLIRGADPVGDAAAARNLDLHGGQRREVLVGVGLRDGAGQPAVGPSCCWTSI